MHIKYALATKHQEFFLPRVLSDFTNREMGKRWTLSIAEQCESAGEPAKRPGVMVSKAGIGVQGGIRVDGSLSVRAEDGSDAFSVARAGCFADRRIYRGTR